MHGINSVCIGKLTEDIRQDIKLTFFNSSSLYLQHTERFLHKYQLRHN